MKSFYFTLTLCLLLAFATGIVRSLSSVSDENTKWSNWKRLYGKSYTDMYEENYRHAIWRYNLKKIESHNSASQNFTVGLNEWSDLTSIEFRFLMLQKAARLDYRGMKSSNSIDVATLPPEVDWRKKGCVTPVINQGQSSQPGAISAVESLEGQHCIVTKQLKSLDYKKLDRCCHSCFSVDDCFIYMIAHNHEDMSTVETRSDNCNFSKAAYGASMTGFVDLPRGSESALQQAVALVGPVSVTIDASHQSFQLYSHGVYYEPACSSTTLDHAVLVVGYGTLNGQDYWLVKNSWGTSWGMKGYILMARNKDNQCGIATSASYPTGVTGENFSSTSINAK